MKYRKVKSCLQLCHSKCYFHSVTTVILRKRTARSYKLLRLDLLLATFLCPFLDCCNCLRHRLSFIMATSLDGDLSHGALLSDSLQRLQLQALSADAPNDTDSDIDPRISSPTSRLLSSVLHEGYGFRPASGGSTPPHSVARSVDSPLPDQHGLGWPGEF
jgi:hypothetical protein